jgi:hypothetical protein
MKWHEYLIIAGIMLLGIFLYHNGVLNIAMPGRKTVSKRRAREFARYVAECANTGQNNLGQSNPPSLTNPAPLPVIDTWGEEAREYLAAA